MADWDMSAIDATFFEVAPENWIGRDCDPLQQLIRSGRPVHLHGVSLNLGGTAPINTDFVRAVGQLITALGAQHYSDHLAASGDAHQLYDLFPIAFTEAEAQRVAGRIRQVQDLLGRPIAVENSTWYANVGDMPEADFVARVLELAQCQLLLDLNNITVNHKNHGGHDLAAYLEHIDLDKVSYVHVAGHEFDARFGLYIDTHSQAVEHSTAHMAQRLQQERGIPILLEWDNDVPGPDTINRELACLRHFSTT